MREICSYGSVGEPVGNHRLYPEGRSGFNAKTQRGQGAMRAEDESEIRIMKSKTNPMRSPHERAMAAFTFEDLIRRVRCA